MEEGHQVEEPRTVDAAMERMTAAIVGIVIVIVAVVMIVAVVTVAVAIVAVVIVAVAIVAVVIVVDVRVQSCKVTLRLQTVSK